jgi:hypothetical protein
MFIGIILIAIRPNLHPALKYAIVLLGVFSALPFAALLAKLNLYLWVLVISAMVALLVAALWLTNASLEKLDQFTLFLSHRWVGRLLYQDFFARFGDTLSEEFQAFWQQAEAHALTMRTDRLNQTFYSPKLATYLEQLCRINREYRCQLIPVRERRHRDPSATYFLPLPQERFGTKGQWVQEVSTLAFELDFFAASDSASNQVPVHNHATLQTWWQLYRDLAANCHLLIPFRKVCVVCQRPTRIEMNANGVLHAVAKPAWIYADGSAWYFYNGVSLPPHIGGLPPTQWQPDWLLTQPDPQVRQVLIAEMGYARICQELPTWRLDTWQDYTLLAIGEKTHRAIDPMVDRVWRDGLILKQTGAEEASTTYWPIPHPIDTVQAALQWLARRSRPQKSRSQDDDTPL